MSERSEKGFTNMWLKNEKNNKKLILLVLLLAFVVRLGYVLSLGDRLYWVDEYDYMAIAESVAEGHGFSINGEPTAFRPAGYPLFLALFHKLGVQSEMDIRLLHVVLGVLAILFVYLIALHLMHPNAALLAALYAALYPYFIYVSGTVLATSWFVLLLTASVFFTLKAARQQQAKFIIIAGLLMGLAVLTRTSAAVLGAAVMLWMVKSMRAHFKTAILFSTLFAVSAALVITPWMLRNYHQFGAPMLSSNGGRNLWLGNNPESTINTGSNIEMPEELAFRIANASEVEADRIYTDEAKQFIRTHPKSFILLTLKKGLSLWRFDPSPTTKGYDVLEYLYEVASIVSYAPIFLLAIFGFWVASKEHRDIMLMWLLFALFFTALHAVFIVKVRFRLPLDVFLIIMAAYAVNYMLARVTRLNRFVNTYG